MYVLGHSKRNSLVNWIEHCLNLLVEGKSINICALDGSGRTNSLEQLKERLSSEKWPLLYWDSAKFREISLERAATEINALIEQRGCPVLLIDDYGSGLLSQQGKRLEETLFKRAYAPSVDMEALRCIVVTHPRDTEIKTELSGLLERAERVHPENPSVSARAASAFGLTDVESLRRMSGANSHLLSANGQTPRERLRILRSTAQRLLPQWIGQLSDRHQRRLADIILRQRPPTWEPHGLDPDLLPLVFPQTARSSTRCGHIEAVTADEIAQLLVGEPWPYGDRRTAARRFRARCGNEPKPLWVDNFLSAMASNQWNQLVEFLTTILDDQASIDQLCILSRDWISRRHVEPSDIQNGLRAGGFPKRLASRLCWKIYGGKGAGNLHGRQLILRSRTAVFALPPGRDVIGLVDRGNEADAVVSIDNSIEPLRAWRAARTAYGQELDD